MPTVLETGIVWGTALAGHKFTYAYVPGGLNHAGVTESGYDFVQTDTFSGYERAQFKKAFKAYEAFLDVKFVKVETEPEADLRLVRFSELSFTNGVFEVPGVEVRPRALDC